MMKKVRVMVYRPTDTLERPKPDKKAAAPKLRAFDRAFTFQVDRVPIQDTLHDYCGICEQAAKEYGRRIDDAFYTALETAALEFCTRSGIWEKAKTPPPDVSFIRKALAFFFKYGDFIEEIFPGIYGDSRHE